MLVDTCDYHGTDISLLLPTSTVVTINIYGKVLQYPYDTVSFFEKCPQSNQSSDNHERVFAF